jgi:hypothetical protein
MLAWVIVTTGFNPADLSLPFGLSATPEERSARATVEEPPPAAPSVPIGRIAMMTPAPEPAGDRLPSIQDVPPEHDSAFDPARSADAPRHSDAVASLLVSTTEAGSTIAAINAVLARWNEPPLSGYETELPMDLAAIAERRGLETLPMSGTISMLRVVNLPAILELLLPGATGPRYAVLAGCDADQTTLEIDGQMVTVSRSFLDDYWLGDAHIISRDFEGLAPTLSKGSRGPRVRRLQEMLADLNLYAGPMTGMFDNETELAVVNFQRSRRLFADALVGRLTRITLYDALGDYEHPRLATEGSRADDSDA